MADTDSRQAGGVKRSMLLLQLAPSDLTFASIKVAYEPPIRSVLQSLRQNNNGKTRCVLDVGVRCAIFPRPGYEAIQRILALMYKLSCSISASLSKEHAREEEVDVRFFLYQAPAQAHEATVSEKFASIDVIARLDCPWSHIYLPQGESSEETLRVFMESRNSRNLPSSKDPVMIRVPGGMSITGEHHRPQASAIPRPSHWPNHASVAVGGTFDHLHAGHKLLLSMTALSLESARQADLTNSKRHLIVGITGDKLLQQKKFAEELEDWETRQLRVSDFVLEFLLLLSPENRRTASDASVDKETQGRSVRVDLHSGILISFVEIFDPFGPTITDPNVDALILSGETRSGGEAVNEKRSDKGWKPLEVFEIDVLDPTEEEMRSGGEDFKGKISSTEIRTRLHEQRANASHTADEG